MPPTEHMDLSLPVSHHLRTDLTLLRSDQTVEEALASLRGGKIGHKIVYFYVLDDQERLLGLIPTRRLLTAAPEQRINEIMVRDIVLLNESDTLLHAAELFHEHRFLSMPVVDDENKLRGVIDITVFTEEVIDHAGRLPAEAYQLIGVHISRGRTGPLWGNFADRFPWLLANIAGGMACAVIAAFYEGLLEAVVLLALFIPVVLTLAESVSIQSMTLTLQNIYGSSVDHQAFARALWREFLVAILLGMSCGACVGLVAWIWKGAPGVAGVIFLCITLSMITACLLGVALPTAVAAMKKDPKIASGPIVLATADTLTLLFYFNIAGWLLN